MQQTFFFATVHKSQAPQFPRLASNLKQQCLRCLFFEDSSFHSDLAQNIAALLDIRVESLQIVDVPELPQLLGPGAYAIIASSDFSQQGLELLRQEIPELTYQDTEFGFLLGVPKEETPEQLAIKIQSYFKQTTSNCNKIARIMAVPDSNASFEMSLILDNSQISQSKDIDQSNRISDISSLYKNSEIDDFAETSDFNLKELENNIRNTCKMLRKTKKLVKNNPDQNEFLVMPVIREPRELRRDMIDLDAELTKSKEKIIFYITNTTQFDFPEVILYEHYSQQIVWKGSVLHNQKLEIKVLSLFYLVHEMDIKLFKYSLRYNSIPVSPIYEEGTCKIIIKGPYKIQVRNLLTANVKLCVFITKNKQPIAKEYIELGGYKRKSIPLSHLSGNGIIQISIWDQEKRVSKKFKLDV